MNAGNLQRSRLDITAFDQPEVGQAFLMGLRIAHRDKLQQIPLKRKFTVGDFNRTDSSTLWDLVKWGRSVCVSLK